MVIDNRRVIQHHLRKLLDLHAEENETKLKGQFTTWSFGIGHLASSYIYHATVMPLVPMMDPN